MNSIEASCSCSIGKIRNNNEDNFYFNGRILDVENSGLANVISMSSKISHRTCFAVFDGMGGEEDGEIASYAAANQLEKEIHNTEMSKKDIFNFLNISIAKMNDAVCKEAQKINNKRMGTTVALLLFICDNAYVCNVGDSRIYRLQGNLLTQLSSDHVEKLPRNIELEGKRKPRLTQNLGIFPSELQIEPYLNRYDIQEGDKYLICSDGITDMLTNAEIFSIMYNTISAKRCSSKLVAEALKKGGRDNATAIVVYVKQGRG